MAKAPAFSDEAITNRFKEAIASKASGVMLDLACGPGMLLASLASAMRLSVGVDVTPKMIQVARATCRAASQAPTQFAESLAECLPFATAAIDCVVTRLSIHHFLDPLVVLREVKRVLNPTVYSSSAISFHRKTQPRDGSTMRWNNCVIHLTSACCPRANC